MSASDPRISAPGYEPRRPETTPLYAVVQGHLETWLAQARARERTVPRFVERELRSYLECGIFAHGFLRLYCDGCRLDRVVPVDQSTRMLPWNNPGRSGRHSHGRPRRRRWLRFRWSSLGELDPCPGDARLIGSEVYR